MSTIPVQKRPPRSEDNVDEAIEDSFPASDPPSYSRTAGTGAPPRGKKLTHDDDDEDAAPEHGPAAPTTTKESKT